MKDNKTFLNHNAVTWLWVAVVTFMGLSPVYMYNASRDKGELPQWFQVGATPFAFLAWAFALGGPFKLTTDYNSAGASIILVLVSCIIPALDKLVDYVKK